MKLNQTEQDILDFCIVPRTANEIMTFVGHKTPPYGALRLLQRIDLLDRISPYDRARATFVQSGRPMKIDNIYMSIKEPTMVMGVRL